MHVIHDEAGQSDLDPIKAGITELQVTLLYLYEYSMALSSHVAMGLAVWANTRVHPPARRQLCMGRGGL